MADDTYSRGYRHDPFDRGGTENAGPATDPLTELARLIGQSDPFATERKRQPDPRAADAQEQHYSDAAHDERYGAAEPQHGADNSYGADDAYNGHAYPHEAQHDTGYAEQRYQHDQAYHPDHEAYPQDQDAYPQDQPPSYYGERHGSPERGGHAAAPADAQGDYAVPPFFGTDPNTRPDDYYEDAPAPRRGWLVTAAALVGLAVVGTAGAFAYRAVFTGGPPSIITRDVGPSKITAALANPDNGASKASERLASAGQNERLGPPSEQPIAIPDPARTAPPPVLGQGQNPALNPAAAMPPAPTAPAQAAGPSDAGAPAPRKVPTVRIKPDQPGDSAAPPRAVAVAPTQPRVAPPAPPANPSAPLSLAPQGIPNAAAPAPAPEPAPAPRQHTTALAPAAPAADHGGGGGPGYYVQVSASKSEEEAKSTFRGIQARHASLLGGQHPVFRRKDLGSKGVFYGAQVGPFAREAAGKLCEDLKAAGQSCMIQKN
jgi:hypothetical protein